MSRRARTHTRGFTFADGMTPMIDVVFLLMIFFLAVARLSEARLIRVELPVSRSDAPAMLDREPDAVVVNVPASEGMGYVINGVQVGPTDADAERAIGSWLDRSQIVPGEAVVWVRADQSVPAAIVVRASAAAESALSERGGGIVRFTSVEGLR